MLVAFKHGLDVPESNGQTPDLGGAFGYLFKDAPVVPFSATTLAKLDDVHRDMVENTNASDGNHASHPPVITYFGQFVDHDITAGSAVADQPPLPDITGNFAPQARENVIAALFNARTGRFDLDSVYGSDTPSGNKALDKLMRLLRFPGDRAMMWIGTFGPLDRRVEFPKDPGGDLLRLERLVETGLFTQDDIDALPEAHRKLLIHESDGSLNLSRAIIGDARNDENLFIAQLHLAFLRFHNRVVQEWPHPRKAGDADEVYEWARIQTRRFYQWLVLNVWLPEICDPRIVREILQVGPKLYEHFLKQTDWNAGENLPIPLEFATACFRFGHSTVRGAYDWNENFGRGDAPLEARASFERMFQFTGSVPKTPTTAPMLGVSNRLPANWGADWERLVHPVSGFVDRSTRRMDTVLASPLTTMQNEGPHPISQNLLARNLRRGILHNLPSAQSVLKGLATLGIHVKALTKAEIASGPTAGEIKAGDFHINTPLWFYTLKEAELKSGGLRLGPLGSHIVAGTIIGLLMRGADPIWETPGSQEGRWHPVDGPRVSGQLVDNLPSFIRAALLMHNPDQA